MLRLGRGYAEGCGREGDAGVEDGRWVGGGRLCWGFWDVEGCGGMLWWDVVVGREGGGDCGLLVWDGPSVWGGLTHPILGAVYGIMHGWQIDGWEMTCLVLFFSNCGVKAVVDGRDRRCKHACILCKWVLG